MDFVTLTDELYGGDPAAFIARRDELAKDARKEGNRELANRIKKLRRPSVSAWYLNLAARAPVLSLRQWLELGAGLRELGAADAEKLRELNARRMNLESRVIDDLTKHLAALGVQPTPAVLEEVRTTLRAALSDADAAEQVKAGRLEKAISYAGFGGISLAMAALSTEPTAATARANPTTEPAKVADSIAEPETDEQIEPAPDSELVAAQEAERARQLAALVDAMREAESAVLQAQATAEAAENRRLQASEAVSNLRAELAAAEVELSAAEAARTESLRELAAAEKQLAAALKDLSG